MKAEPEKHGRRLKAEPDGRAGWEFQMKAEPETRSKDVSQAFLIADIWEALEPEGGPQARGAGTPEDLGTQTR